MIKMYIGLHAKYLLFLSDFNKTLIFFDRFSKKKKHSSYLIKIRPVDDQLSMRTNRRTDMQLVIAFHDSASAPKNRKLEVVVVNIQHYLKTHRERERGGGI